MTDIYDAEGAAAVAAPSGAVRVRRPEPTAHCYDHAVYDAVCFSCQAAYREQIREERARRRDRSRTASGPGPEPYRDRTRTTRRNSASDQQKGANVVVLEPDARQGHAPDWSGPGPVRDQDRDDEPEPVETFWSARPALRHLLEFARARRAGPWAVLGVVLARAVVATEPNVVLPPTIGSAKSINLFVALVGPPGGGKGAAEGAATDAVEFIGSNSMPIAIEEFPLGSGEGIARTFQTGPIDEDARGRSRAMFSVPEVDTIAAIGARQGSTLMAELRKVYMGEQIGFANANKNTRTTLAAHSYRACMTIGVQPLKAGPLLDDADGGTPQRFLWLPVSDPDAPDERPAEPEPMRVKVRAWTARVELNVPEVARQEMDAHRLAVLRGDDVDPLDGHRMLTRLKVAAALSILDAREIVTEEDWQLAGTVIRVSDRTRAEVKRAAAERAREAARARAEARAEEAGVIADRADERIRQRARAAVLRYLDRHSTATRKDLRGNMRNDLRGELDATLDDLLAENVITSTGGVYALA
ncbi:hypothetical protein [Nocardia farcinica]